MNTLPVCLRLGLLTGLLAALPACASPVTYSAEPIETWIVDAETKKPLEGVIVVAHWVLEGGIHVDRVGDLVILETVTDRNGRFHFSAWGPIRHWSRSRLTYMDPEMLIFRSGYEYRRLANPLAKEAIEGKADPVRRSDWNGKTIELKPFKGTSEEYVRHLSFLMGGLRFIEDDCQWKKTPNMILELQKQMDVFKAAGIVTAFYSIDYLPMNKANEAKCGSPKEFFKSYRQ